MILHLRQYQKDALDAIRDHYAKGRRRVLLHLATGGGKTLIFCTVLKSVAEKGKRAIMVVRGKDLVDQASQRLFREGVPHGVMQGNHWNYRPHEAIQVCSIDTLYARRNKQALPAADLVVIDEAHYAASKSFMWLIAHYKQSFFLPVSATPHVKTGLRHIADEVVYPISIGDLIKQGYLSPPRYYAPTSPNLSGVTIDRTTGDYKSAELGAVMTDSALYGDMVAAYRRCADGRSAVCFAVTCEHSMELARMFSVAGIPAEHVEANTPQAERQAILKRLETGVTKIVTNVGILCVGVDMPYLGAIIMARPTMSYNLFIQQIGRGTRIYEGKNDFVVLDHANNLQKHGLIEYERECNLDGKQTSDRQRRPVICKECFAAFQPQPIGSNKVDYTCPECKADNTPARHECGGLRATDCDNTQVLAEVTNKQVFMEKRARQAFVETMCQAAARNGYKPGWVFHKVKNKYGDDTAKQYWKTIKKSVPEPDNSTRQPRVDDRAGSERDWVVSSMAKPDGCSLP